MQRLYLAFAVLLLPAAVAQTPRYAFTEGTHTVYRRVVKSEGAGAPTQARVQQLQYWTIESGTRNVLLGELTDVVDRKGRCVGGIVLNLEDRGPRPLSHEFLPQIDRLAPLLEPWPHMPEALRIRKDWDSTDIFGRTFRYRGLPRDPAQPGTTVWEVELLQDKGSGALFGQTYRGTMWFDTRKGILRRSEGNWTDPGTNRTTRVVLELFQQEPVAPDWLRRRTDELRRYRTTLGLQARYLDRLARDPSQADRLLSSVGRFWSEQALQLQRVVGPIRRLVNERRVAWEAGLASWQQRALQVQAWRDVRPPRWLLLTSTGKAVRSEELGVPVLELLWSPLVRGSGVALEDLRKLRDEVPLADLAIICIHLHGDAEDLANAQTATGPKVLHLRPEEPAYDESLLLPIARLRDADGTVQQIGYGARPVWREWLEDKISVAGE